MPDSENDQYLEDFREVAALFNAGDTTAVMERCQSLIEANPERSEAFFLLGILAWQFGDKGRAVELFEVAHKLDPECQDYVNALASGHTHIGQLTDGLFYAKLATTLKPHATFPNLCPAELKDYQAALHTNVPSGHYLTACRAYNNRDWPMAVDAATKELRVNANNLEAQRLLGRALGQIGEHPRAIAAFQACVHMAPNSGLDQALLGAALAHGGHFLEAEAALLSAASAAPRDAEVFDLIINTAAILPFELQGSLNAKANAWRRAMKVEPIETDFAPEGKTKIRVGYLTDSCASGPYNDLLRALLLFHDAKGFEVYVYQNFPIKDKATTPFESAAASWREIHDVDDETAAYIVAADELDILVDLNLEPGTQRHAFMAMHPAKVQVSWIGSPAAVGWPGIDVVLTDSVLEAADQKAAAKKQHCEKLRGGLLALEYPQELPMPELPAKQNGYVTFAGVLDLATLHPNTASLWADALRACPGALLLLGSEYPLSDHMRVRAMDLFANCGAADRIRFHEPDQETLNAPQGLASLFSASDIVLDSAPISNGSPLIKALWMGLPVITLQGKTRAGALGASIVAAANRNEWIVKSNKTYARLAAELSRDIETLDRLRAELRENNPKAVLFNPPVFARTVEAAYRSIMAHQNPKLS